MSLEVNLWRDRRWKRNVDVLLAGLLPVHLSASNEIEHEDDAVEFLRVPP